MRQRACADGGQYDRSTCTMGDLAVGNYDLTSGSSSSNAFIYNIAEDSRTPSTLAAWRI